MINDKAEYERAGKLAARARINGDEATAKSWAEWVRRALALETPDDSKAMRAVYDQAYRATRELDMRFKNLSRRD